MFVCLCISVIEISGVERVAFIQAVKSLLKLEVECLPAVRRLYMSRNWMKGLQIFYTAGRNLAWCTNCLKTRERKTDTFSNLVSFKDELRLGFEFCLFAMQIPSKTVYAT